MAGGGCSASVSGVVDLGGAGAVGSLVCSDCTAQAAVWAGDFCAFFGCEYCERCVGCHPWRCAASGGGHSGQQAGRASPGGDVGLAVPVESCGSVLGTAACIVGLALYGAAVGDVFIFGASRPGALVLGGDPALVALCHLGIDAVVGGGSERSAAVLAAAALLLVGRQRGGDRDAGVQSGLFCQQVGPPGGGVGRSIPGRHDLFGSRPLGSPSAAGAGVCSFLPVGIWLLLCHRPFCFLSQRQPSATALLGCAGLAVLRCAGLCWATTRAYTYTVIGATI